MNRPCDSFSQQPPAKQVTWFVCKSISTSQAIGREGKSSSVLYHYSYNPALDGITYPVKNNKSIFAWRKTGYQKIVSN